MKQNPSSGISVGVYEARDGLFGKLLFRNSFSGTLITGGGCATVMWEERNSWFLPVALVIIAAVFATAGATIGIGSVLLAGITAAFFPKKQQRKRLDDSTSEVSVTRRGIEVHYPEEHFRIVIRATHSEDATRLQTSILSMNNATSVGATPYHHHLPAGTGSGTQRERERAGS